MGSGVSALNAGDGRGSAADESTESVIHTVLKKLPDSIEEALYIHEKFPLICDPTDQAARFLKYQNGPFLSLDDPIQGTPLSMNRALVASLQNGRTFTVKVQNTKGLTDSCFEPGTFPKEVLSREQFFKYEVWSTVLKPALHDPDPVDVSISPDFAFVVCTPSEYIPPELAKLMCVIKVDEVNKEATDEGGSGDPELNQIAELYGAKEIVRNSLELVEAAFDGDLEEVKAQIAKGYHLESVDGRKHSALSEASCQGHVTVVNFLLDNGADPNSLSDTGRTPLWRAAFNQHKEVVKILLEAGGNPEMRDKVSMETVYDVAQEEEIRDIISNWDMARTMELMEERRRVIMDNLEARIRTSVEREQFARDILRQELVKKATTGDVDGIKEMLTTIAAEAEKSGEKPRVTAEVRNNTGQSLLSIAAQRDDVALATFLLTSWKTLDEDKFDLMEGEVSKEAKVFKANPNSRDMKGWSCACIAIFHDARKVLALLLEHGADPNIRSSYHKNAWDLAKDELDAANKVVKSNKEIRQVLIDHSMSVAGKTAKRTFGNGEAVRVTEDNLYADLDPDGSAVVMNIEMNKEMSKNSVTSAGGAGGKSGTKKAGGKPKGGGTGNGGGTTKAPQKKQTKK